MSTKKKLLIICVLCVVVLAGVFGGFAIASANDGDSARATLFDKIAEIYQKNTGSALDAQELQKAFTEAGTAARTEACNNFIQKLVDNGKLTQEQADALKAWMAARPDSALSDEFKAWMQARPDIPGMFNFDKSGFGQFGPNCPGQGPFGGRQGFGMMRNRLGMMDIR
jgi:hypothetical protein